MLLWTMKSISDQSSVTGISSPRCVETASANAPIEEVISDEYTLDDIQKAFDDSISRKNEVIKAVIRVD